VFKLLMKLLSDIFNSNVNALGLLDAKIGYFIE
jgi:hypothetical protein